MKTSTGIPFGRRPQLLALVVTILCSGCSFLATKYNQVTCRLPDTEANRAEATRLVTSIAREFALKQVPAGTTGDDNHLAQYHLHAGLLSLYVHRGRWQFAPEDIADFESLARKLKGPQESDRVSQWLRQQLPPDTLAGLSNYPGGPDPELEKSILRGVNDTLGGAITKPKEGIIYNPQRFAEVRLSKETRQLLDRTKKLYCDIVELNERLLRDAYPQEIAKTFETGKIKVSLYHHNWSGRKPKQYIQIENRLTNDFKTTFGDAVQVQSGRGWLK